MATNTKQNETNNIVVTLFENELANSHSMPTTLSDSLIWCHDPSCSSAVIAQKYLP